LNNENDNFKEAANQIRVMNDYKCWWVWFELGHLDNDIVGIEMTKLLDI
jgi:hypothetical protein